MFVCLINWSMSVYFYDFIHMSGLTGLNGYFHAKPNCLHEDWMDMDLIRDGFHGYHGCPQINASPGFSAWPLRSLAFPEDTDIWRPIIVNALCWAVHYLDCFMCVYAQERGWETERKRWMFVFIATEGHAHS